MENPEEILHSLEEFSKMKPKDIPRELEEYLCFVAKTGNPVYQWPTIKILFREKLLNVITEFYESCPSVEIPPCPNVEMFNYDIMKNFILEKLDTFASAPFTVQRICELLTTPRKEYNRIDKYMRALEKNILVVSTMEPGRRSAENGESIMNGIEPEHLPESSNSSHDINVEEMDESPSWPRTAQIAPLLFGNSNSESQSMDIQTPEETQVLVETRTEQKIEEVPPSSCVSTSEEENSQETISCPIIIEPKEPYVSIEPVVLTSCVTSEETEEDKIEPSLSITALPAGVQQRRNSVEKVENLEERTTAIQELENDKPTESEKAETSPIENVFPDSICQDQPSVFLEKDKHLDNTPENCPPTTETSEADSSSEDTKTDLENTEEETARQSESTEIAEKIENSPTVRENNELTDIITSTNLLESSVIEDSILKNPNYPEQFSDISNDPQNDLVPVESDEIQSDIVSKSPSEEIEGVKVENREIEAVPLDPTSDVHTSTDDNIFIEINVDKQSESRLVEESSTSSTDL